MMPNSPKFNPDNNVLPEDFFKHVHGFLSLHEAHYLFWLASQVVEGGNIVEIGAYQARSTIALAMGAREARAMVWSIDHHPDYEVEGVQFGMRDNQAYYRNIADYNVGAVVRTINLSSMDAFKTWRKIIDLLFIDGSHEFNAVYEDWVFWGSLANTVALHDTAGHHPGVSQLVQEILDGGLLERIEIVDSISVFKYKG